MGSMGKISSSEAFQVAFPILLIEESRWHDAHSRSTLIPLHRTMRVGPLTRQMFERTHCNEVVAGILKVIILLGLIDQRLIHWANS